MLDVHQARLPFKAAWNAVGIQLVVNTAAA